VEQLGYTDITPSELGLAQAASSWQSKHGLGADGIIGPKTWRKLEPLTRYSVGTPKRNPLPAPTPPSPRVAKRGRLLASEGDVSAGALEVNDAYDLALYEMSDGSYELSLFMKLQFFFRDGADAAWTSMEKLSFMRKWQVEVAAAWNTRTLFRTKSGKSVSLSLNFEVQGGFMFDHWEIDVVKIKPGSFSTSAVVPRLGNVKLDSEDLTAIEKRPGKRQVAAAHEFGHMLGLADEYHATDRNNSDGFSIMGPGSTVRNRHLVDPRTWAISKLKKYGIE
jgi:hypothetical protein